MTLIANVFPELPSPKNMIRSISKKSCFRGPFDREYDNWVETMLQSERQDVYNIY